LKDIVDRLGRPAPLGAGQSVSARVTTIWTTQLDRTYRNMAAAWQSHILILRNVPLYVASGDSMKMTFLAVEPHAVQSMQDENGDRSA
jgi:hypothetical protein